MAGIPNAHMFGGKRPSTGDPQDPPRRIVRPSMTELSISYTPQPSASTEQKLSESHQNPFISPMDPPRRVVRPSANQLNISYGAHLPLSAAVNSPLSSTTRSNMLAANAIDSALSKELSPTRNTMLKQNSPFWRPENRFFGITRATSATQAATNNPAGMLNGHYGQPSSHTLYPAQDQSGFSNNYIPHSSFGSQEATLDEYHDHTLALNETQDLVMGNDDSSFWTNTSYVSHTPDIKTEFSGEMPRTPTKFEQGQDDDMSEDVGDVQEDSPMSDDFGALDFSVESLRVDEDDEAGRLRDTRNPKRTRLGSPIQPSIYAKHGVTMDTYGNMPMASTPTNRNDSSNILRSTMTDQRHSSRIAGLKGRTARSVSPTKGASSFSGFGQQPQQGGSFSFGQPNSESQGDGTFGQPQSSGSSFSFGQQQGSSSFAFGQSSSPQAGTGATFNFGQQSASFPQSGSSSPFQFGTNQSTQPVQGFQGSIFNTQPSGGASPSQQQPTNGFATPVSATTPMSSAMPPYVTDEERAEIKERERWMTTDQMKRLEELAVPSLAEGTGEDSVNNLADLPTNQQRKILEYVRSLSPDERSQQPALLSIFDRGCRSLTKKGWVYDQDRAEIRSKLGMLSPKQREEVVAEIKEQCYLLKWREADELPDVESLPPDTQSYMLEYVREHAKDGVVEQETVQPAIAAVPSLATSGAPQSPSNPFASLSRTPSTQETPKINGATSAPSNPFANSIKATSPQETPKLGSATPASAEAQSKPFFGFGKTSTTEAASSQTPSAKSPFSLGATSTAPSISHTPASKPSLSFTKPDSADAAPAPSSVLKPNSGIDGNKTAAPASPAPSTNIFDLAAKSQPPATTKTTGTASSAFGTFAASSAQKSTPNIFAEASQSKPNTSATSATPSKHAQTTAHGSKSVDTNSATRLHELNTAFKKHLASLPEDHDWSAPVNYFLSELKKIKTGVASKPYPAQSAAQPSPATGTKRRADDEGESAPPPAKKQTISLPTVSPQKPLSATASIFSKILDTPEKPQQSPAPASPLAVVPSAQSMRHDATPAAAPVFNMPKFAGGSSAGTSSSTSSFLAAFGQKADKEAQKEKAKRKAADFDSDEDDEEEWNKKDAERQEEKRRKLAGSNNKVLKNVDGQFVLVDEDAPAPAATDSPAKPTQAPGTISSSSGSSSQSNGSAAATPANPFAHLSNHKALPAVPQQGTEDEDGNEDDTDDGAPSPAKAPTASGGLFGRVGAPNTTTKTPQVDFGTSIFGKSTKSPAADQTWKPESPIKFDGSTTPQGSPAKSLFNFGATSATPTGGMTGFQFGGPVAPSIFSQGPSSAPSLDISRATTPGTTTADEGSTAATEDGDAAPPEEQRDLTSLSAQERANEEVLFEQKARCKRFQRGEGEPWQTKGVGPLRLLKNKQTGNVRVLQRQDPSGTIMINANLIKDAKMYSSITEKQVKMVFAEAGGELGTYSLGFGSGDKAKELLEKVHEEIS